MLSNTASTTHFWLKSGAVTLTLGQVAVMSDEEARLFLAELRWGDKNKQACPDCGTFDIHHSIRTRKQWRCKHCFRTFSVTTGTPFADHKIGYRRLALALMAFVVHQKGIAALALRRIIGGQYRTSFTLLHKIREAVMLTVPDEKLTGIVDIDGAHFSGRKRKGRKKKPPAAKQIPKKYHAHRSKMHASAFPFHPNRRIVITLRKVSQEPTGVLNRFNGKPITKGAVRTLVAVCRSENTKDVEALIKKHVERQSTIRSDELPAYGNVKTMGYSHEVVNHSVEFSSEEGYNENQAESFFSRMRRSCIGVYHRITPRYMLDYATEMAWREDARRLDTGVQVASLVQRIFGAGISADWLNYCRGNKRQVELLFEG